MLEFFLSCIICKVYNDAEWNKVRQEAQGLYSFLEKEEGIEDLKFVENWHY